MQRFAQIGLYFFFSSELSYSPAFPQVTASRVFHVHSSDRQKPLAKPVFIGENIGVCLSQDSPHHPRKRSTDWPVKRRYRKCAGINRHVVGNERVLQERRERIHLGPE